MINDKNYIVADELTLMTLIEKLTLPQSGSVFAVNEQIIAKQYWDRTRLNDGDHISLFQVIAGG
ncbi:sulfur carrier protein ThiS [Vibrio quintilis]|nr:sulfur carrier protein ThiS [Vibrio quintilis]